MAMPKMSAVLMASLALLAAGGKVTVEIMVETYCPCSGAWEAAWERDIAPKIGEIAELQRFFDAKKNGTQGCCDPSADAGATCMHKQSECVADSLQRCVQEHYPTHWLDFTNCISGPCGDDRPAISGCTYQFDIGSAKNLEREQACAQNLSMSWSTINECWQGEEGVQLMQGDADKSNSIELRYGISGLPVVWIDGQLFSHFMKCPTDTAALIQAICAASDATPLPDACKPTAPPAPQHQNKAVAVAAPGPSPGAAPDCVSQMDKRSCDSTTDTTGAACKWCDDDYGKWFMTCLPWLQPCGGFHGIDSVV